MAQSGSGMLPPKRKIVVIVSVSVPVNPSKAGQVSDQRRPRIPGIRFLLSDSAEKKFPFYCLPKFLFLGDEHVRFFSRFAENSSNPVLSSFPIVQLFREFFSPSLALISAFFLPHRC